jgi:hypothetical protein
LDNINKRVRLEISFYGWHRADERAYALPGVEQPKMDPETRIAMAARQKEEFFRSKNEDTTLKRSRDAGNDVTESEEEQYKRKRTSNETDETDYAKELEELEPKSNEEEMNLKLQQCNWHDMLDDVMAELGEDDDTLDTETEADESFNWDNLAESTDEEQADEENREASESTEKTPDVRPSGHLHALKSLQHKKRQVMTTY